MMAPTFSYIIPPSPAMAIGHCKKETRSNSKLFRDQKVPRRLTSRRPGADAGSNHLAGGERPLPAIFLFKHGSRIRKLTNAALRMLRPLSFLHTPIRNRVDKLGVPCKPVLGLVFMGFGFVAYTRVQHEVLRHREVRGNDGVGRHRRGKRDQAQDWQAPGRLGTGHEPLRRLVPTQGEQDSLTLSDSSQGGFPDELPIRLKKNRYKELLRACYSLENQEGLHFQVMTCAAIFQRELLLR